MADWAAMLIAAAFFVLWTWLALRLFIRFKPLNRAVVSLLLGIVLVGGVAVYVKLFIVVDAAFFRIVAEHAVPHATPSSPRIEALLDEFCRERALQYVSAPYEFGPFQFFGPLILWLLPFGVVLAIYKIAVARSI